MAKKKTTPEKAADAAIEGTTSEEAPTAVEGTNTPAEEVGARTIDSIADEEAKKAGDAPTVEEQATVEYVKEFVLGPGTYTEAVGYNHDANKSGTRDELINSGLRPVGEVEHVSTKTHRDGKSKVLTYKVTAVPAHLVTDPEVAHVEVVQGTGDTTQTAE